MADPKYWELALEEFKKLRLCFGHSGGQAYWFGGGNADEVGFSEKVVELCRKRPNVYCEVGYMQQVLIDRGPENFAARLAREIEPQGGENKYALGDKIMYGTDWHMLHKEENHRAFLQQFVTAFELPALQSWKRKFFAENAMRYLKLPDLANNPRFTDRQRQYWRSLVAKAGVTQNGQ